MGSVQAKEVSGLDPAHEHEDGQVVNLTGVKARVDKIHIDGLRRTKDDYVTETVRELFTAEDFQQVIIKSSEVCNELQDLGCFKNVAVYIDTSSGPDATEDGLEVTFHVRELRRMVGGVNTLVGQNEGSLVLGLRCPNILGRGEKLQAEYTYGSKKSTGFNTTFVKPLQGKAKASLTSSVFQQSSEWPWSGYGQVDRGFFVDLAFRSAPQAQHSLRWEAVWRDLSCLTRTAAFAVREEAGHSLKSSLRHTLTVDERDSTVFPTDGALFRLQSELAGLGGNIGFFKNELELQYNLPLVHGVVLQASLLGGLMNRLQNDKTVGLCDRFFLGGPLNVRGFQMRGLGPHSDGNSIGAETYWASGLHLYTPLPFRPGRGGFGDLFRTHLFVNAGNLGNFDFSEDYHHNLLTVIENLRLAYGLGISLKLGEIARLELNYCVPVRVQPGDKVNHGLQFGIGVNFL